MTALRSIHPFLDGVLSRTPRCLTRSTPAPSGRSRAALRATSTNTRPRLAACDLPRRNDLDGRGNFSEENLAEFTKFSLTVCLDQVRFMERLMQPDQLCRRILTWADEKSSALSRRTAARRRRRDRRHRRTAGPPRRVCTHRPGCTHDREHARASAPCFPRRPRIKLDARAFPRKPG
jgi:hypothetical protein